MQRRHFWKHVRTPVGGEHHIEPIVRLGNNLCKNCLKPVTRVQREPDPIQPKES